MNTKALSRREIIVLLTAGVIASVTVSVGKPYFFDQLPSNKETVQEKMTKGFAVGAEQANARGPVKLDEDTRLDKTRAGPGARLAYFYTLIKYKGEELDHGAAIQALKSHVAKAACADSNMRGTIEDGATYAYNYVAKDGVDIGRFEINKQECSTKKTPG